MRRSRSRIPGLALAGLFAVVPLAASAEAVRSAPEPAADLATLTTAPATGWWTIFGDPALDRLIARLHASSPQIAQAAARLAQARAEAKGAGAARLPAVGIDATATHAAGPLVNAAGTSGDLFTLRAAAGWELDLLGRLGAEQRAARHTVTAATASLADVTLLMEGEAVRAWFTWRAYAAASAEGERINANLADQLAMVTQRRALGLVGPEAADSAQRRLATARAEAADYALARDRAARQIGYLLGETAPVAPPADPAATALPEVPPVPADLAATLLARRPDVRAARERVLAADAHLDAVRRAWLPPITLTASAGQASSSLAGLLASAASSFGLGALLAIPVFDGGRHKARVAGGRAGRDLAEAQYRETVAAAFRDVGNDLQALAARRDALTADRDAAARAAELARQAGLRQANGTLSRQQWREGEMAASQRQLALRLSAGRSLLALVDLQQACGGGW